jgi:FkbM family methyltransferase
MGKRPLAIRFVPRSFRVSVFDRFYSARRHHWRHLYSGAAVLAAPSISMQLIPGDRLSDLIAFTGTYEEELTRRVTSLGRRGGKMIDIGANLGYFSLIWASCNSMNQCVAFEPAPRNLEVLRQNVAQNEMTDRVRIIPAAASAQAGQLPFDPGPEDQRGWGGITLRKCDRQIEVQSVRVDEVVSPHEAIALLKVDVEGADTWALMGCEHLLKSGLVKEIWFEQNKPRMAMLGIPQDAAQKYLTSLGYLCKPHDDPGKPLVEWSAVM